MKNLKLILILCCAAFLGTACVKTEKFRGYTFKQPLLEQLAPGQSTQADILQLLGTPSATSTYGDETWYYISSRYTSVAFFEPKLESQTVLTLRFDMDGILTEKLEYSEADARKIHYSKEITPSEGHDLNVIEQLLGNVGRFSSEHRNKVGP